MSLSSHVPRYSQCEKIMRVLRDGRWHTAAEIHQLAGFSRLNSRISELRRRGYIIEHETTGVGAPGSRYRLLTSAESESDTSGGAGTPSPVPHHAVPKEVPSDSAEQLELIGRKLDRMNAQLDEMLAV